MANIYLDQILGGGYISGYSGVSGFSGLGLSGYSGIGTSGFSGYSGPAGTGLVATDDTSTTALYPVMVGSAGSSQTPKVSTANLLFNAATGALTATSLTVTTTSNLGDVGNITITGGSANQVLQTNGSGVLTWAAGGGGGGGATLSAVAASTTYYVGLSANSTGSWTDARVATSNLYYTSGDGTLYATNMNTASDMNLKDNILTITNPLHTLSKLHGVEFTWKNTGRKSYGVIAQELEKVLPELVNVVDGYKSVNYSAIIGFLLEAVKELNNKIERLEAK